MKTSAPAPPPVNQISRFPVPVPPRDTHAWDNCFTAPALTTESHRVLEDMTSVHVSLFGWAVVIVLGCAIALVAIGATILFTGATK